MYEKGWGRLPYYPPSTLNFFSQLDPGLRFIIGDNLFDCHGVG
jgi:hypothetical protein